MKEIGKVTVKHYLEKKVNPIFIYGDIVAYPVYLRITVNRRTTQLKSIIGALMSEKAFAHYSKTREILYNETITDNFTNLYLKFEDEPHLVQKCIETLALHIEDYDFSGRNVRDQLMYLLTSVRETFIKVGYSRDIFFEDCPFLCALNRELSVISCLKLLNERTKDDFRKYIPTYILEYWQTIELVKCSPIISEMPMIEFLFLDYHKYFLDELNNPASRTYCLIDYNYDLKKGIAIENLKWIVERFYKFIPG